MSPMYLLWVMDNIGHSCRQNIPNHEHPQRFAKTPSPWQGSITPLINMSGWGEIGFQFLLLTFVILRHFFPKPFQEIYSIKRLFGKVNFVTHAIRWLCNQMFAFANDMIIDVISMIAFRKKREHSKRFDQYLKIYSRETSGG